MKTCACVWRRDRGRPGGALPDECDRGRPPCTSLDPGRFKGITGTLLWLLDNYRFRPNVWGPNHFCMEKKPRVRWNWKWCFTQALVSTALHEAKRLNVLCFAATDIQYETNNFYQAAFYWTITCIKPSECLHVVFCVESRWKQKICRQLLPQIVFFVTLSFLFILVWSEGDFQTSLALFGPDRRNDK